MSRPRAALAMSPTTPAAVFDHAARVRLARLVDIDVDAVIDDWSQAADAEVLITGWGAPRIDSATVDRLPKLRAILHSAGTVKTFLDSSVLDRGITVSTAAEANAIPVAEYTYAAIVFGAKRALPLARRYRAERRSRNLSGLPWLGTNGITIGVVGASRIGRRVLGLLQSLNARVLLYDPYLSSTEATGLGARLCDLDTLLRDSAVVTLHAPANPETRGLLDARRLSLLRDGAVVVNTARGSLIDHDALLAELRDGRIDAILDVAEPEPPGPDSELYTLPNVLLTPHIAGALGNETRRLGEVTVSELARWCSGQPLRHELHVHDWHRIA
ncbi:MAG: hydroxyacid dehydrogenase [Stackebrandtia sp.]